MDSTASSRMSSRRRPLHTCGVSMLAIIHRAYTKAEDLNGPLGSMTRRIARLAASATPFVYALQYQWLAILSFVDDHILVLEKTVETLFPPSNYVFNKIDELVQITETLPGKFDDAVNRFPLIVHQVPLLDWALVHVISWLNFFICTLTHWGSQNAKEKEIMIDINCNERENESASVDEAQNPVEFPTHVGIENKGAFPPISETIEAKSEAVAMPVKQDVTKGTYKEVLEKGTKENIEKKEDNAEDETPKGDVRDEEVVEGENKESKSNESIVKDVPILEKIDESMVKDDPILELFESGWLKKPEKRVKGNSQSRSVSYA